MKIAGVLALIGAGLAAFGWWGIYTAAGMRRFDEMDGMIPFFAGVAGLALLAVAAVLALVTWRRSARRQAVDRVA